MCKDWTEAVLSPVSCREAKLTHLDLPANFLGLRNSISPMAPRLWSLAGPEILTLGRVETSPMQGNAGNHQIVLPWPLKGPEGNITFIILRRCTIVSTIATSLQAPEISVKNINTLQRQTNSTIITSGVVSVSCSEPDSKRFQLGWPYCCNYLALSL